MSTPIATAHTTRASDASTSSADVGASTPLTALFEQRYGARATTPASLPPAAEVVLQSLLSHRSVRKYLPRALPSGTLELLIAAAQSAASSSNLQLWSTLVVSDRRAREALSEVAGGQAHIRECPLFLVWIADLHRATEVAASRGLASEGLEYLEMFLMASIDAALAAQNAVVAAEALGLGTVYIGALRNDPERVASILGLPPRAFAVFGLCVGFPDPEAATAIKPRLPQAVVVHAESYAEAGAHSEAVAGYDGTMQRFYTEQRMPVLEGGWSIHSAKRVASAAALRGRDALKRALGSLGFELK